MKYHRDNTRTLVRNLRSEGQESRAEYLELMEFELARRAAAITVAQEVIGQLISVPQPLGVHNLLQAGKEALERASAPLDDTPLDNITAGVQPLAADTMGGVLELVEQAGADRVERLFRARGVWYAYI